MKTDVIKTLIEMGINEDYLTVNDKSKVATIWKIRLSELQNK